MWLLFRGLLTDVSFSEQPPELIAAKTIVIAHLRAFEVRRGVRFRGIGRIVRRTVSAGHGSAQPSLELIKGGFYFLVAHLVNNLKQIT